MAQDSPSRHLDQLQLRLPDGLREWLKKRAQRNLRSMNNEVVAIIIAAKETEKEEGRRDAAA
jgi:plasmid stability protein